MIIKDDTILMCFNEVKNLEAKIHVSASVAN